MKLHVIKQLRSFYHSIMSFMLLILLSTNICQADPSQDTQHTILLLHNKMREWHHAAPLTWDDNLATYARSYARQCKFKHSGSGYGENLAAGYPSIADAIQVWYGEEKNYSYLRPGFSHDTGHFTQVVWKGTEKIGCAYVACNGMNGTPGSYLVCEYSPAGNISNSGFFANNVEAH